MTEDDKELEILKAKRLAEMQKNLAEQENEQVEKNESHSDKNSITPREQIIKKLGHRGLEVLTNAESQFPNCLLYTSPSPRDGLLSRMPSSA